MKANLFTKIKKSRICVFLISLTMHQVGWADPARNSLQISPNYQLSLDRLMTRDPLSLEQIGHLVASSENYDDFIKRLGLKAPELFENAVILHHSASLQHASFENPRVLLFGRGTVLGFSEDPNKKERVVELLAFNPSDSRFKPAEIEFLPGKKPTLKNNPKECGACHGLGDEFRPLWQPYDVWPNAFGARAGVFFGIKQDSGNRDEEKAYKRFIQNDSLTGIYASIAGRPSLTPRFGKSLQLEGNTDFTQYISSFNFLKMMTILKNEFKQDNPFRYALLAGLNGCILNEKKPGHKGLSVEDFIPTSIISKMPLKHQDILSDTIQARKEMMERFISQYGHYFVGTNEDFSFTQRLDFENGIIGNARFILENLGIEWSRFTLSMGENLYSMAVPTILSGELGTAFRAFSLDIFLELMPKIQIQDGGSKSEYTWAFFDCEKLAKKSREALTNSAITFRPLPAIDKRTSGSGLAPMARCVQCHAVKKQGPYIPFDDGVELQKWLRQKKHLEKTITRIRSGSMPLDSQLSTEEREALELALRRLAQQ
jgi:hypothetical protein